MLSNRKIKKILNLRINDLRVRNVGGKKRTLSFGANSHKKLIEKIKAKKYSKTRYGHQQDTGRKILLLNVFNREASSRKNLENSSRDSYNLKVRPWHY